MIKYFSFLLIVLLCIFNSCARFDADKKNFTKDGVLFIPNNATYTQVLDSLKQFTKNIEQLDGVAKYKEYPTAVKPGKFAVKSSDTNESLINRLINNEQEQVKVMIRNSPTLFHLARDASKNIIADSASIIKAIENHPKFKERGLDLETAKIYFLPNTYFFYWLTDADMFVNRMIKEHDRFWTDSKKKRLEDTGMSELEVYTLASIVQMEAPKADEQKMVAEAYLNRLEIGMKLDSDPTSVYAYKLKNGFSEKIQRVLNKHTAMASKYNTYKNAGLPPSPICLPNSTAIDAVLEPASHDFIYFCADPKNPGYHKFATNYREHQKNAAEYHRWLNKNKILK